MIDRGGNLEERLVRLEKKIDEALRLLRLQHGPDVPPEKKRRVIDGREHQFLPGAGWVPTWPEPPAKRRK